MNSPCRSAVSITARSIAPVTSELGGRQPALTQSRSLVSCGRTLGSMRAGWSPRARRKRPLPIEVHSPAVTLWSLRRKPDERRHAARICVVWRALSHRHDGHIYLDLADEHWRAIEIGPDGWRVNN